MMLWAEFWRAWLIISGVAFAGITLIVACKGLADLRTMFRELAERKGVARRVRSERI